MVNKKLFLSVICLIICTIGTNAQTHRYVGAFKCKMCHNTPSMGQQYKIWSESVHAKALSSLSSDKSKEYAKNNNIADPAKEPKCLKCHSTVASIDKSLIATITPDEAISCESCHGPGSDYNTNSIMKDKATAIKNGLIISDEQVCLKCHNPESPFYQPFDFAKAKEQIAHPIPPPPKQ